MSSTTLRVLLVVGLLLISLSEAPLLAQQAAQSNAGLQINFGPGSESFTLPLRIIIILTLLAFLPAMVISMTSFTRIIVVAHFLRQALGTQSAPNNQILIGLTLFLTFFVMGPVWDQVYDQAVVPYQDGNLTELEALSAASVPLRGFMLKHVRDEDLVLFLQIGKLPRPKAEDDLPLRVIVPAFMISELKTAFQIGFVLFLPFLVIDMVVSSILLSTGMMMLPPIIISTPFKILLFILVDGWNLVVGSLLESFYI
jgi:flagellar biosynthetic protein FliP